MQRSSYSSRQSVYSSTPAGPRGGAYVASPQQVYGSGSDLSAELALQEVLTRHRLFKQRQREAAGYPPSDSLLFSPNPTTSYFHQSGVMSEPLYERGLVSAAALQAVRDRRLALSEIIPRNRPDILSSTGWRQLESLCLELAASAVRYYGLYSEHTCELYRCADELRATAVHVDSIQGVASPDSFYLRTPRASDYAQPQLPQAPLEALVDPMYYHPVMYEQQPEQSDFDAWYMAQGTYAARSPEVERRARMR